MAEVVHEDVLEQILIGLDVKDLICCKSVYHAHHPLVGSSNGLVCTSPKTFNFLVANPLTREVRHLRCPPLLPYSGSSWGFGYDSSTDEYKVIQLVLKGENQICVRVLSLKSNVWRVTGEGKCTALFTEIGILCSGALHWIVKDENKKIQIISYDISKEKVKEIPLPERFEYTYRSDLGIIKECLCIYKRSLYDSSVDEIWLMKYYNVEQSWELLLHDREMKYDIVHYSRSRTPPLKDESYFRPEESWFSRMSEHVDLLRIYIDAPIFVQSLVSPHVDVNVNL